MLQLYVAERLFPDVAQLLVVLVGLLPYLQLSVEEPLQFVVGGNVGLALRQLLPGRNLQCAQLVLVCVVGVNLLYAQCCVAVAFPPAAQVQLVVDAPYAVSAAEGQSHGIVLAVAGIRETDLAC